MLIARQKPRSSCIKQRPFLFSRKGWVLLRKESIFGGQFVVVGLYNNMACVRLREATIELQEISYFFEYIHSGFRLLKTNILYHNVRMQADKHLALKTRRQKNKAAIAEKYSELLEKIAHWQAVADSHGIHVLTILEVCIHPILIVV